MKKMYELTDVQVNTFHEKGWLGPLDTFSVQEVESVKKAISKIEKIEVVGTQKIKSFQNMHLEMKTTLNHHLYCRPLSKLFEDERVVSRLNQLGEANLLLWRTSIFHRMPGEGKLGEEGIGWHQAIDNYGYDGDETKKELVFPEEEKPLNLTV